MKMIKKLSVFVFLWLSVGGIIFAAGAKEAPKQVQTPKMEEKVVLYANMTAIEPVLEAFTAKTGIKVENTRLSTSRFLSTVLTEFEAGKLMADLVQAPLPILEMLKEKGVLSTYTSPVAQGYPDWSRKGGIQLFGIEYVAYIYNKQLVNPGEIPKRYEDLADPRWKNRIVMANPENHPTTIGWLVGLKENIFASEAEWRQFLKGLAENNPMFVASFGPTPEPIASGEKHIGISMPKYIITKAPAPLDWARVTQPIMGTPRAIALTSKAPRPNAAKAFLDFWLGTEAATIMAQKVGEYVLAPGVYPPIDGMDKAKVIPIRELSDSEIVKWGNEFKAIFNIKK